MMEIKQPFLPLPALPLSHTGTHAAAKDEDNNFQAIPDKYLPRPGPVLTCVQDDFRKGASYNAKQGTQRAGAMLRGSPGPVL